MNTPLRFAGPNSGEIVDRDGTTIAVVYPRHIESLELWPDERELLERTAISLVRAVNAHADLVESLTELVDHAERYGAAPESATRMFDRARAALAKAKVQP